VLDPQRHTLARVVSGQCDAEKIEHIVRAAPWPPRLERQLARALSKLDTSRRLAVRSSMAGEDGADASHAGQFRTLLDVRTAEVAEAVRTCWLSAFADHVAHYRRRRGVTAVWPRIAVIVQEMADSEVAGVAFTADPRTGAPAYVVAAGYGLGSGIVGDRVQADMFTRPPWSEEWRHRMAHKTRAVRSVPGAGEPAIVTVPAALANRPALTSAALEQLAGLLDRLDRGCDGPMDVEWASNGDGQFALLQARPLTALPRGDLEIWDDSNIGENFPGLTLPLTASYVRWLYARLFRNALVEVGLPRQDIAKLDQPLQDLLELIRGRLYLNLTNYYRMFAALPGFGWTVGSWEAALGIEGGDSLRSAVRLGRRFSPLTLARTARRLVARFRQIDSEVEQFTVQTEAFLDRWNGVSFEHQTAAELVGILNELNDEFVDLWTVHIFNDLFLFVQNTLLERLIGDGEIHRRVIAGIRDVGSLEPLISLFALADTARSLPQVDQILQGPLRPEAAWERMSAIPDARAFKQQAAEHLRLYGDRTGEELKLETPALRDQPWALVSLLRGCRDAIPPRQASARESEARAEAERTLRAKTASRPWMRPIVWSLLNRVRRGVAAREYLSFARARGFGILRRLVRAIGANLADGGVLRSADDVFFLTMRELAEFVSNEDGRFRLKSAVAHRRSAYATYARERLPHRLACRGSVHSFDWSTRDEAVASNGNCLRGIPSASGMARGRARVVEVPSPHIRTDGEILVAPATEPAWMFLMYAARGVVVERGSILSHAAIIGRELGIPTVVAVEGATTKIRTGDTIEVNGITGDVRILNRAEE
jgi:pyruvate,water dikinase